MVGKLCCALAMSFQIKKSFLHELSEFIRDEVIPQPSAIEPRSSPINLSSEVDDDQALTMDEFVQNMTREFEEYHGKLMGGIEGTIHSFSLHIR